MFRKPPPPPPDPPKSLRSLAWPEVESASQSTWLNVVDWDYKVFPFRSEIVFGNLMFQFGAIANSGPLKGLEVAGEIEVLEPDESPGMFADYWKVVPEKVEGHCCLIEKADKLLEPLFGVTLYCSPRALDHVYRAFSIAAQSRIGAVSIDMTIDCPNNTGASFWSDSWRKERLRVVNWKLFSGARIRTEPVA